MGSSGDQLHSLHQLVHLEVSANGHIWMVIVSARGASDRSIDLWPMGAMLNQLQLRRSWYCILFLGRPWFRFLGGVALTVGSVPRRIGPKLRQFDWLFIFNNQWKWRNLGTILRGTDPTISATAPDFHRSSVKATLCDNPTLPVSRDIFVDNRLDLGWTSAPEELWILHWTRRFTRLFNSFWSAILLASHDCIAFNHAMDSKSKTWSRLSCKCHSATYYSESIDIR